MCLKLSSIAKKQIVAITGLLLILFIIGHLAGNMLIFGGPVYFNKYADKLHSLGLFLRLIECGLAAVFVSHIALTVSLVLDNIKARGGIKRYDVEKERGKRSLATRLMPLSGLYIFGFVVWHIFDFTIAADKYARSFINGKSQGLYGVVVNAFSDPVHALLYVIAVSFLGLHLSHGVESLVQTFGYHHPRRTPQIIKASRIISFLIALGYSSIPLYVLFFLK